MGHPPRDFLFSNRLSPLRSTCVNDYRLTLNRVIFPLTQRMAAFHRFSQFSSSFLFYFCCAFQATIQLFLEISTWRVQVVQKYFESVRCLFTFELNLLGERYNYRKYLENSWLELSEFTLIF